MNYFILVYGIGLICGILLTNIYLFLTCRVVGTLNIDSTDEEKDKYLFNIDIPLDDLSKHKMVRLKIASQTSPNMNTL